MAWATHYIEKLKQGQTVQFRPVGRSMEGRIASGNLVTVTPAEVSSLEAGDIVLCQVKGAQYLHLILKMSHGQFQIGNNKGHVNGWINPAAIFGKCIKVEA